MSASASHLRVEPAVSAGGVVYRRGERGTEFLLCGRTREQLWALPKGTPEYGETVEQAALREVREETGIGVTIEAPLGTIDYSFSRPAQGVRFDKTVHHYLMRPDGTGDTTAHDAEYDRVEWFPAAEAASIITHRNEARVLRRALRAIEGEAVR
ncbi:MAG: NUDIX hydrolase [Chloroflexota bacterium]|nr:NUDIX hydrolase [Chloroflexota bacterium]